MNNINPEFNKILSEALSEWDNIAVWDKICKEVAKMQEEEAFNRLKAEGKLQSPVIICSRKIGRKLKVFMPNICVLATDLCEDDKAYMVTDETIADNIRQYLRG